MVEPGGAAGYGVEEPLIAQPRSRWIGAVSRISSVSIRSRGCAAGMKILR